MLLIFAAAVFRLDGARISLSGANGVFWQSAMTQGSDTHEAAPATLSSRVSGPVPGAAAAGPGNKPGLPTGFLRPPGFAINTADFRAEERFGAFLRLGMFSLQICHAGRITGAQGGPEICAEGGDALFLHMNTVTTMSYSDGSRVRGLYIDPSRLRPLLKASAPASPAVIPHDNPGLKLLSAWLLALSQAEVSQEDGVRPMIDQHVIDLVALALGARDDVCEEAEARTGKSARLQAVLGLIAAHYCKEPLTARDAAMRLGISERYVRQLLEETGFTFTEHVRERRLLNALRMLGDPRFARLKIGDIAQECGFADATYFNRVFRRRFGETPSDARKNGKG
jgi:AraC-like DNA-binding protein